MGSKWNHSGCCGQCAGCNHCGNTGCDTAADCCDTCGLNTEQLDISASCNGNCNMQCGCGQCASCNSCGNTGCSTDADCCDTCGLTINPDGSQLVSNQGGNHPRRRLRTVSSNGCGCRTRRNYAPAPNNVNCGKCGSDNCSCGCDRDTCGCKAWKHDDCDDCNNQNWNRGDGDDCGCKDRKHEGCDDCGKSKGNRGNVKRNSGCNGACHSASVFHEVQELNETYATEEALFQGTLFPELNKPMAAKNCTTKNCATRRQLAAFEAWELRLYLNTHPEDQCALNRWKQLCREACKDNYATAFTGDCDHDECWQWMKAPWPWEYQCCGNKRNCSCND